MLDIIKNCLEKVFVSDKFKNLIINIIQHEKITDIKEFLTNEEIN